MNRALTFALTFSAPLGLLGLGCDVKASRAQCTEMLDRYIYMTAGGEPSLADLSAVQASAARDTEIALRKADTRYARVQQQCEAEITRREYRCAMKAPSPETWQACID